MPIHTRQTGDGPIIRMNAHRSDPNNGTLTHQGESGTSNAFFIGGDGRWGAQVTANAVGNNQGDYFFVGTDLGADTINCRRTHVTIEGRGGNDSAVINGNNIQSSLIDIDLGEGTDTVTFEDEGWKECNNPFDPRRWPLVGNLLEQFGVERPSQRTFYNEAKDSVVRVNGGVENIYGLNQ